MTAILPTKKRRCLSNLSLSLAVLIAALDWQAPRCLAFQPLPTATRRAGHAVTPSTSQLFTATTFTEFQPDAEDSESSFASTLAEGAREIILSWEAGVADLIRQNLANRPSDAGPYVVGLVGNPGSGKSTSCEVLSHLLSDIGSLVMPFDGYHIPMADLKAQPNAQDLIYRRGAPDTFHPQKLQEDLGRIRAGKEPSVSIPGFDHELGDPTPDQHEFRRDQHRVVLCEGLYLLHDDGDGGAWKDTKNAFDLSIFVNANVDMCVERLKIRNKCIPGYTESEIEHRCEVVDRANALTVEGSKRRADILVDSVAGKKVLP